MPQPDMPTRTVWNELWEAHPILYTTLNLTTTINTTLLFLFLIAFFSTAYDALCIWLGRRIRQNHTYNTYTTINGSSSGGGAVETAPYPYGILSHLARTRSTALETVYAKAAFHASLCLGLQYTTSYLITHGARILASAFTLERNAPRRQCARLLERGLECDAALHFHDPLLVLAAAGVLCAVRGFGLHVELPNRARRARHRDGEYSLGFLRLMARSRGVLQTALAVPSTVVWVYSRISRDEWRKYRKLLLLQAFASLGVFVVGNGVCAVAALPDFQGTMEKLHGSGITGRKGV